MEKKFKILGYELMKETVEVEIQGFWSKKFTPITISREHFYKFLEDKGKLEWELNESEAGEHKQTSGTMTLEEYWDNKLTYIYDDIYEFIVTHPINFRGVVYENSLDSILPQL